MPLLVDGHDTASSAAAARIARAAHIPVVADVDNIYPGLEALLENVDYLLFEGIPFAVYRSEESGCAYRGSKTLRGPLDWSHNRPLGRDRMGRQQRSSVPRVLCRCGRYYGAGDVFHAAFIYALLELQPVETMLDFSCAAAALSCTAIGARGRIASLAEIRALMQLGRRSEIPYSDNHLRITAFVPETKTT